MFKKKFSKYFSSALVLTSLLASGEVKAQISPKAFKGITKFFNKGKESYSPTLGKVALDTGLIYNLRFYGNFERHKTSEGPNHIQDIGEDSLSALVKELFPSPAGQLVVETIAEDSFGKYVKDPRTVATLLNFSNKTRQWLEKLQDIQETEKNSNANEKEELKQLEKNIKNLKEDIKHFNQSIKKQAQEKKLINKDKEASENLEKLQASLTQLNSNKVEATRILASEKQKQNELSEKIKQNNLELQSQRKELNENFEKVKQNTLETLLESLKLEKNSHVEAIMKAIEKSIKEEAQSFYPAYSTEQIINAFFCEKFNTQKDIWNMLKHLDSGIIDRSQTLPEEEEYFAKEDLGLIARKDTAYDLEVLSHL